MVELNKNNLGGTMTTGSSPRRLMPGVRSFWDSFYGAPEFMVEKMYDTTSSDKAYELDVEEGGFGLAPVKNEGSPIKYDSTKAFNETRTRNVTYGLGYIITRENIEDNQYDELIKRRTKSLSNSMKATKEYVGSLRFANNDIIADSQPLFSVDHTVVGGVQSNILDTPSALSRASLEDVCTMITEMKDIRGLPIAAMPKRLVVTPKDQWNAKRILNSYLEPDTPNNAVNPVREVFSGGLVVNPYFTGYNDNIWFVRTSIDDAFKYQIRREIELAQDDEFDTENLKVKATERYAFALVNFRGAVAGNI